MIQPGPTITGNVRNSLAYNDWSEHWAIGNLNGLYGFSSNAFGVGLGRYANNSSYVTIDPLNGFAIKHKNSSGIETKMIELDSSGNGYFRGNINSTAVITGGVIQSASTGKRISIDSSGNDIKFYNSTGDYVSVEGYLSSGNEKRLHIGGTVMGDGDLFIAGSAQFSNKLKTTKYLDTVEGIKIDEVEIIDKYYNATLNNVTGNEFNGTKYKFSGSDLITARPAASKILVSDSSQKLTASSVAAGELYSPAICELYDNSGVSTITCDGASYVKWSNASIGLTKGIEGSTGSDCAVISTGYAGKYEANYSVSFKVNSPGDYYWALKIGSNTVFKSRTTAHVSNIDYYINVSGCCLLELSEWDQISIGCLAQSGSIVTVIYMNLSIIKCSN